MCSCSESSPPLKSCYYHPNSQLRKLRQRGREPARAHTASKQTAEPGIQQLLCPELLLSNCQAPSCVLGRSYFQLSRREEKNVVVLERWKLRPREAVQSAGLVSHIRRDGTGAHLTSIFPLFAFQQETCPNTSSISLWLFVQITSSEGQLLAHDS